jgi:hypothetical protein
MAEQPTHSTSLLARADQPLIAIFVHENGRDLVRYFVDDDEADAQSSPASIQRALDLAGAWSDLDWDEMEEALDRIRHESIPTPPIEEL